MKAMPRPERLMNSSCVSRDRATKVRDYLVKKFTLSPDYIGVMPMGAAGGQGDGIALVLLKK